MGELWSGRQLKNNIGMKYISQKSNVQSVPETPDGF
jgi:hypothetical protein